MTRSPYFELDTEELRNIITGKTSFRKCPCCNKEGLEYWEETGVSVLPYPHPDWGDNYESGPCDECDGLGYVQNPS